jgi:hypothetical protein
MKEQLMRDVRYLDPTAILTALDDKCPACGGELDTGHECNACNFDALPMIEFRNHCEQRAERQHPSGLYESEMQKRWPVPVEKSQ